MLSRPQGAHTLNWRLIIFGFAMLLLASFLDNLRGPLLPQITESLRIPYGQSSSLIFAGNIASVVATLALIWANKNFRSRTLAKVSLAIAVAACLLSLTVDSLASLMLFSIVLGSSVTIMGSLSNVYVIQGSPVHRRARILSGLHSLYGVGSVIAALAVAAQTRYQMPWHAIFMVALIFFSAMLVAISATRSRSGTEAAESTSANEKSHFALRDLFICLPLTLYVLGEVGCSTWLVTFVTQSRGFSETDASLLLSAFFAVMAVTRIVTFLAVGHGREWLWMRWSMTAAVVSFVLGITVNPYFLPATGLFGPFFPLYVSHIRVAKPQNWQSMALISFAMIQGALACLHYSMGSFVDAIGAESAYWLPVSFLVIAWATTLRPRQVETTLFSTPA